MQINSIDYSPRRYCQAEIMTDTTNAILGRWLRGKYRRLIRITRNARSGRIYGMNCNTWVGFQSH